MPEERPHWPAVLHPFVAYRPPPTAQPTRSDSPRDVWADVRRFLERAAKPYPRDGKVVRITAQRWSAESANGKPASWFGEWPAECSVADFDAAMRLANERFGKPQRRANKARLKEDGFEEEQEWHVPVDRVDEVLGFLERVPACTGGTGGWAPVSASYSCLLQLRDLQTGEVLPGQGERYHPLISSMSVRLQRRSTANLLLVLPFAQPDDRAADYVVALQAHLPVYIDPRYLDHMTPASDNSRYHRLRLPPDWTGLRPGGQPRLDASRSGIPPADLPTDAEMAAEDPNRDDAPFYAHYAALEAALRDHTMAALVIRGRPGATRHLVTQAAERLGMPLHVVSTDRPSKSRTFAAELRATLSGVEGRPSVLLVELDLVAPRKVNAAVLAQVAARAIEGVELPTTVRLVMMEHGPPGEEAQAISVRLFAARYEGLGSAQQIEFLERQNWRAAYREVAIVPMPLPLAE
jgi:hypothetical protein